MLNVLVAALARMVHHQVTELVEGIEAGSRSNGLTW
ncbi:hypothetical protein BMS3Bbin01_01690 [bacterium BMS3Bbin01]|nr:hypothetical protein BMS3Bbin01_01690 [bacterium BMS3Bbin01]